MDDVYRDRQDPALTVAFELIDGPWAGARLLAWTTTPWTLPANLALAVGPDIDYAVVEHDGVRYVLAADRLGAYARRAGGRRRAAGRRGHGAGPRPGRRPLPPLFDFFTDTTRFGTGEAFQVLGADFVSTEDGTGVVHLAPGFGEDDQLACNAVGIPTLVPMDEHGRYTAEVGAVGRRSTSSTPTPTSPASSRRRASSCATRPTTTRIRTAGGAPAARVPGHLLVVRRGDQVPRPDGRAQRADHVGARAPPARQLRQVAAERPRLVDQPQPLLGLADPGLAQRRPGVPAGRRLRLAGRAGGRLRRDGHRPPPPGDRRAGAAEPRRPDRSLDDAARPGGPRLLVRVRLDAVRPGALPVRERASGSRTTTRATSSSSTRARPAAGSTRCTCWRRRCSTARRSRRASPTASSSAPTG